MQTLDEFIAGARYPSSAYVIERGFSSLYVRKFPIYGPGYEAPAVVIANITAKKPGRGFFTRLIKRLHSDHNLLIECVQNERLGARLLRMGFEEFRPNGFPFSYVLLQSSELKEP